jgi:hypothetical protein
MIPSTTQVLVSVDGSGKIKLTVNGAPGDTIQPKNGDSVSWSPEDPANGLVLLFPPSDKPVHDPVYFGFPGQPITIPMSGTKDKHYRYSIVVYEQVAYTKSKPGELEVRTGEFPPKFTVNLVSEDPVVIIR